LAGREKKTEDLPELKRTNEQFLTRFVPQEQKKKVLNICSVALCLYKPLPSHIWLILD